MDERAKAGERNRSPGAVTRLLERWKGGDGGAIDELMDQVYGELRGIAVHYMRLERSDHTLSPTGLVHETYLRLLGEKIDGASLENRKNFYSLSARCMRRILVEHARRYLAARRASPKDRVALNDEVDWIGAGAPTEEIIAVDQALERLRKASPRQADVVELRYYGGLSETDIGEVLGISRATVTRDWQVARLFLSRTLGPASKPESASLLDTAWRPALVESGR